MSHKSWTSQKQTRSNRILKRLAQRIEPRSEFLVPLRVGEELCLSGIVELRVLRGCADVWGSRLRPSSNFERVIVPPWSPVPRLRAVRSSGGDAETGDALDLQQFLSDHNWPVVLCVREVSSGAGLAGRRMERMRELLMAPAERPRLTVHASWPSLADQFTSQCVRAESGLGRCASVLVMGPKGVGKSTCCRYFVNRLLSEFSEVCFLETDLGQPELGPPGLVALRRVKRPLLGVPHAEQHSHEQIAAFFAGGVSPGIDPTLYMACVNAAVSAYQALKVANPHEPLPLVVNSHGWSTGLGLEIIQQIVRLAEVQLVIRLCSAAPRRQVSRKRPRDEGEGEPEFTEEPDVNALGASSPAASLESPTVLRRRGPLLRCGPLATALGGTAKAPVESARLPLVLVDIESPVKRENKDTASQPLASEQRWLRFACYFRPDIDPCASPTAMAVQDFFSTMQRLRISLKHLHFGLVPGRLTPSEVEPAMTGTVVALCHTRAPLVGDAGLNLAVVECNQAMSFLAYAFIHSFDFQREEMTFYSPLSPKDIGKVNLVLRGDLAWQPNSAKGLQVAAGPVSPLQPYCAPWLLEGMGVGARVVSTRGNIRRRRLQAK